MIIIGLAGFFVLLCIIGMLWASGSMTTRQFNWRGRNKVEPHEPHPRTPGLN